MDFLFINFIKAHSEDFRQADIDLREAMGVIHSMELAAESFAKRLGNFKKMLQEEDAWLIRGMKKIFEYQTEAEQRAHNTIEDNGVGFNGVDAGFLTSLVEQHNKRGKLSPKQIEAARKAMKKYAGQLSRILEEENPFWKELENIRMSKKSSWMGEAFSFLNDALCYFEYKNGEYYLEHFLDAERKDISSMYEKDKEFVKIVQQASQKVLDAEEQRRK